MLNECIFAVGYLKLYLKTSCVTFNEQLMNLVQAKPL